jgi:hypothetical protein
MPNGHKTHFPLQDPLKFTKIGTLVLKTNHLAIQHLVYFTAICIFMAILYILPIWVGCIKKHLAILATITLNGKLWPSFKMRLPPFFSFFIFG